MIRALKVIATEDFHVIADLEDGRTLKLNMSFIKNESGPVVEPLKTFEEFKKVFIKDGIVTWSTGYDVDPYFLVEKGTLVKKTA